MRVKKTIQLPNGNVQFDAELTQEQLDFVIEVGLGVILVNGASIMEERKAAEEANSLIALQ